MEAVTIKVADSVPEGWSAENWSNFNALAESEQTRKCFAYVVDQLELARSNTDLKESWCCAGVVTVITSLVCVCAMHAATPLLLIPTWAVGRCVGYRAMASPVVSSAAQTAKLTEIVKETEEKMLRYRPDPRYDGDATPFNCHAAIAVLINRSMKRDTVFNHYQKYGKQNLVDQELKTYLKLWCVTGKVARRNLYYRELLKFYSISSEAKQSLAIPTKNYVSMGCGSPFSCNDMGVGKGDPDFNLLFNFPLREFKSYLDECGARICAKQLYADFAELKEGLRFVGLGTILTGTDRWLQQQKRGLFVNFGDDDL